MRNVFIFHGTAGKADGNWFPWIKAELEKLDCHVVVPQFPTPEGQSLEAWLTVLDKYKQFITEDSIFIGHSLGGMFLLKVLEQLKHHVYAAFFVAAPIGIKPIKYYDSDYEFTHFEFNWPEITKKAQYFAVWHSDNDPYISLGNGEELAKKLGVQLHFIPHAGHLNAESGYTTLPPLLEEIKKII